MFRKYKNLIIILSVAIIYFTLALLSLNLAFANTNVSPIWPPSGLAFAAVMIFGRKALIAIFLGALAANLVAFQGNHQFSVSIILCSLMIGLGNTLEAYLGEKFCRSFCKKQGPLESYQNYFKMLMVTFAACLAGAMIGSSSLLLTGIVPFELYLTVLATWWMGDYVGILIVSTLILSFVRFSAYERNKESILEYSIHLLILVAVSALIFSNIGNDSVIAKMSFILLPFLLWMVYRFSVPFIALAVTIVSFISVYGTVNGHGPFVSPELNDSLLLLQAFMGIISVTFVALSLTLRNKNSENLYDGFYSRYSVWFSSISFIVCLSVSLFVIHNIESKNDAKVEARIEEEIVQYNHFIASRLEYIAEGLSRMAKRRGNSPDMLQAIWEKDARSYYEDYEIFRTLEWVDSSFRVKWVYPMEGNEHTVNLNLNFENKRKTALENARDISGLEISKSVDLLQGGRGMVFCVPVNDGMEFKGFILGVIEHSSLFSSFLEDTEKNYFVEITIDGIPEYKSVEFLENHFKRSLEGSYKNLSWSLKLVPKPEFLAMLGKESSMFSIVLAFLISVLFSLTVYLVFNARFKARSLFELNEDLTRKNEELKHEKEISQQAVLAKSQFLANMSHEIRTPMNGVLGALQLAMDGNEKDMRNYLKVIDISARSLMDIINDILDYSKIEAGKLHLEVIPFDLRKLIQEALIIVEGKAKSQKNELKAEFALDPLNNFKGDPTRIRQILLNLLSNAVKFTNDGSVTVRTFLNEAQQVCIDVEDTGVGISQDKLDHIFEQFEQADTSTTREYGGTGLGLAITKQLVDLMDGEISVESQPGKGTKFKVMLPLGQTDIKLVDQIMDLERKYGKRVLLCEDNQTNQQVIKDILLKLGLDVEIVDNGQKAIETVEEHSRDFDLILMDLHMPEMDGFKSTARILKIEPDTPIIALTANTTERDRQLCFELGMKGYLTKPVQKKKLISELDKWLGQAS